MSYFDGSFEDVIEEKLVDYFEDMEELLLK
jgi:hypothetical protein